jgi:toxin ParE1/3/4
VTYAVEFGPEARDQLASIEDHIAAAASPVAAAQYVDAIVAQCAGLGDFPLRGRARDDLMVGLRFTYCRGRVAIAYRADELTRVVSIVGVFYGGQDYESQFPGITDG